MAQQDIKALLEKISSGNFTAEEEKIAKYWLLKLDQQDTTDLTDDELEEISREMWASLEGLQPKQPKVRRLWPRIAAAASIILCCSVALYYYQKHKQTSTEFTAKNDIAPGKNTATLTLANGKRIILSEAIKGQLAKEAGSVISKNSNGQISYEAQATTEVTIGMNTLATAKGEQYQVVLPDGSHVWLNAASSLKYPASFASAKERKVELTGEAYFEIAKDKAHPFIVNSNKQDVKVLGTHFDINSYSDEPSTKTTLLEGSIQLNNTTILKPGEQADLNPNGNIAVNEVNASKFIAWKNGKFVFDDENIQSVMRKLARWYNVEVVYEGNVSDRTFTGSISRFDNISKILDKITYTQTVHFKIEGRRITVIR
jgi:ferric-dicitrate binding protein FerR (iron transport regulator)